MEKFQIAKYGMMQVTALVYSILICSLGVKLARPAFEAGMRMNDQFYVAMFMHNYGVIFFLIILGWTWMCAYGASPTSAWEISESDMASSAITICLILLIGSTIMGIFASMSGYGDLLASQSGVATPTH